MGRECSQGFIHPTGETYHLSVKARGFAATKLAMSNVRGPVHDEPGTTRAYLGVGLVRPIGERKPIGSVAHKATKRRPPRMLQPSIKLARMLRRSSVRLQEHLKDLEVVEVKDTVTRPDLPVEGV